MSSSRRSYVAVLLAVFAFVLASSINAFAQQTDIKIKNFGQMDDRFYRGGQPKEEDYKQLAAIGIKTVIDLRQDPTDYEKRDAEAAGMRYVNLPMSNRKYPRAATINQFLNLVDDPVPASSSYTAPGAVIAQASWARFIASITTT